MKGSQSYQWGKNNSQVKALGSEKQRKNKRSSPNRIRSNLTALEISESGNRASSSLPERGRIHAIVRCAYKN